MEGRRGGGEEGGTGKGKRGRPEGRSRGGKEVERVRREEGRLKDASRLLLPVSQSTRAWKGTGAVGLSLALSQN